jgi:hypothetical protein
MLAVLRYTTVLPIRKGCIHSTFMLCTFKTMLFVNNITNENFLCLYIHVGIKTFYNMREI